MLEKDIDYMQGRLERFSWAYLVKYEMSHIVKKERNILHRVTRRKANWIGHILLRKCHIKHVI